MYLLYSVVVGPYVPYHKKEFAFVSPQAITLYVVKAKRERAALSAHHHGVRPPLCQEADKGSPGWVARNLRCATEC